MSWEEVTEADRRGLLEHSREFLDLFWDIAKMEQQTRLEATEKLLEYLRARPEVWLVWDGAARGRHVVARAGGLVAADRWPRLCLHRGRK